MKLYCAAILFSTILGDLLAENNTSHSLTGYNHIAKVYDKGRPDYPPAAIAFLIKTLSLDSGKNVLDLAAGTGKLTKALLQADIHLTAMEPVEEMRMIFTEQFPNISIFNGKAEDIPLLADSLDALVVGTAFHWFETETALKEIARVLKPGGALGLIWNIFDGQVEWVHKIRSLLEGQDGALNTIESEKWKQSFQNHPCFTPLQHTTIRYSFSGTAIDVLNRVFSAKIMGTLTESQQQEIVQKVLEILSSDPSTQDEIFNIPYRSEIYWCFRLKNE